MVVWINQCIQLLVFITVWCSREIQSEENGKTSLGTNFSAEPKYLLEETLGRALRTDTKQTRTLHTNSVEHRTAVTGFGKLDNLITKSFLKNDRKVYPQKWLIGTSSRFSKMSKSPEKSRISGKVLEADRQTFKEAITIRRHTRNVQNYHHHITRNRPQFIFTPIEQIVAPGSPVSLKCVAIGAPPLSISWSRDSMVLVPSLRIHIGNRRRDSGEILSFVNISNTNQRDGGLFTCMAENAYGRESSSARLHVYGPPFIRPMLNISAVAGRKIEILCPYGGYPKPQIKWEFNGQPLEMSSRHQSLENGSLLIPVVKGRDRGRYSCIALGREGRKAMSETYMKILFPPAIEKLSFADDLEEGFRTSLICMVTSGDLPITIRWMKNGQPLLHDQDIQQKQISEYSMLLLFERLSARHSGNYTCVATNSASSSNRSATLIVKVPPKWVIKPSDVRVSLGGSVKIDCQATGVPKPITKWIQAVTEKHQPGSSDTLYFSQIQKSDAGSYRCEASNGVGPPISQVISIEVNAKATITSQSGPVTGHLKRSSSMHCEAKGDPPIYITWKKNDRTIVPTERILIKELASANDASRSVLEIKWLQTPDQGDYVCEARNNFGRDMKAFSLQILEPPSSPSRVTVNRIQSRSAVISWKNSSPSNVVLQYKEATKSWNQGGKNRSISQEDTSYELRSLYPFTTYAIRIFAINELGPSFASKTVTFKTKEDAPSSPPTHIRVSSVEPSTLHIAWNHPEPMSSKENVRGFLIAYKEQNMGDDFKFIARPASKNKHETYTIRGLKPSTLYEVALQSFNNVGDSPLSSPRIVQETMENVPECSPVGVHCREDNIAGIRVWWEAPHSGCRKSSVYGYSILATPVLIEGIQTEGYKTTEVTTTNLEKNLGRLPAATNISIVVKAFNHIGYSPPSKRVFCPTKDAIPNEVENVRLVVVGPTSIAVTWSEPSQYKGDIIRYTVYFEENGLVGTAYVTGETVLKTSKVLNNFNEGARVQIWVTASTLAGEGRASPKSSIIINPVSHAPIAVGTNRIVFVPQGFGTTIGCLGIGNPKPTVEWLYRHRKLQSNSDHQILPDNDLHVRVKDSTNYTCRVSNTNGEDTYAVKIIALTKPSPPHVTLLESTINTLNISINHHDKSVLPILGYSIFYRQESGEWQEISANPTPSTSQIVCIRNLQCGSSVRLYATRLNAQGSSSPSSVLMASTKGGPPLKPNTSKLLVFNETCLQINFYEWPEDMCPITHWKLEMKGSEEETWKTLDSAIGRNMKTMSICTKQLTENNFLKLTAFSIAGESTVAYRISVEGIEEGWINKPLVQEVTLESRYLSSTFDPHVIAGVISGILLCSAIGICSVVIAKKRCYARNTQEVTYANKFDQMNDPAYIKYHIYSPTAESKKNTYGRRKSRNELTSFHPVDNEIYPYATFSAKTGNEALPCGVSLQMGSPVSRICYETNQDDRLHNFRKGRARSHYDPSELVYVSSKSLADDHPEDDGLVETRVRNKKNIPDESSVETLPLRINYKEDCIKHISNRPKKPTPSRHDRGFRLEEPSNINHSVIYQGQPHTKRPHRDTPVLGN